MKNNFTEIKFREVVISKTNENKKSGNALFEQIKKAADMALDLKTPAGKDAYTALCEVMREFSLARRGFNEE